MFSPDLAKKLREWACDKENEIEFLQVLSVEIKKEIRIGNSTMKTPYIDNKYYGVGNKVQKWGSDGEKVLD